jgi:hypothetical protein
MLIFETVSNSVRLPDLGSAFIAFEMVQKLDKSLFLSTSGLPGALRDRQLHMAEMIFDYHLPWNEYFCIEP